MSARQALVIALRDLPTQYPEVLKIAQVALFRLKSWAWFKGLHVEVWP